MGFSKNPVNSAYDMPPNMRATNHKGYSSLRTGLPIRSKEEIEKLNGPCVIVKEGRKNKMEKRVEGVFDFKNPIKSIDEFTNLTDNQKIIYISNLYLDEDLLVPFTVIGRSINGCPNKYYIRDIVDRIGGNYIPKEKRRTGPESKSLFNERRKENFRKFLSGEYYSSSNSTEKIELKETISTNSSEKNHLTFDDIYPMRYDDFSKNSKETQKDIFEILLKEFPYIHMMDMNRMLNMNYSALLSLVRSFGYDPNKLNQHKDHKEEYKKSSQRFLEWVDNKFDTYYSDARKKMQKGISSNKLKETIELTGVKKDDTITPKEESIIRSDLKKIISDEFNKREIKVKKPHSPKNSGQILLPVTIVVDVNDIQDYLNSLNISGKVKFTILEQIID